MRWPAALAYSGAALAALLLFYSAFAPLLIAQAQAAAAGGLTGLAQRAPVPRWQLWQARGPLRKLNRMVEKAIR